MNQRKIDITKLNFWNAIFFLSRTVHFLWKLKPLSVINNGNPAVRNLHLQFYSFWCNVPLHWIYGKKIGKTDCFFSGTHNFSCQLVFHTETDLLGVFHKSFYIVSLSLLIWNPYCSLFQGKIIKVQKCPCDIYSLS